MFERCSKYRTRQVLVMGLLRRGAGVRALTVALAAGLVVGLPGAGPAAAGEIEYRVGVDLAGSGPAISDTMYGVFFEDINRAADGGLYAELVQNRSFEYDRVDNAAFTPLTG